MKKYEIMVIVQNSLGKKEAEKFCQDKILKRIKDAGGVVLFEDFWGERGFAYRIKQDTWGYYFVAQFELEGAKLLEIRRELNIEKHLVRFLITKVDKNAPEPRKYQEIKAEYEAQEKARLEENKPKENPSEKPDKLTTIPEAKSEGEEKKTEKDELDKKLDDIVSESSQDL